jgi:hypothetical protein
MKHSAKAAARLERERSKQERRRARRQRAGGPGQPQGHASDGAATGQPAAEPGGSHASTRPAGRDSRARPGRDRGLRATASRAGAAAVDATTVDATTGDPITGDPTTGDPTTGGQAVHQKADQLPYAIVLAGVVAGLVLMQVAKDAVRGGTFVIAGALLAASLTRLVLPEGRAGLLGSRRRLVDVALLTVLGAGLLTAGLIAHVPG